MLPPEGFLFEAYLKNNLDKSGVGLLSKNGNFYLLDLDKSGKLLYIQTNDITHWSNLTDNDVHQLDEF